MNMKTALVATFAMASASIASAGDTVTLNMPGGATQTVSSTAVAAGLGRQPSSIGVSADSPFASITQSPTTGEFTFTSAGGNVYTVSPGMIERLLAYYD